MIKDDEEERSGLTKCSANLCFQNGCIDLNRGGNRRSIGTQLLLKLEQIHRRDKVASL